MIDGMTPELRDRILSPFMGEGKATARARVEAYLRQPAIVDYLVQLNAVYAANSQFDRHTNCYAHAMGVTFEQYERLQHSGDQAMQARRCLQPGMVGGLLAIRNVATLPVPIRTRRDQDKALKLVMKMQQAVRRLRPGANARRMRVKLRGHSIVPLASQRKRLYLLSDGLIETDENAAVPNSMRRIFFCTGRDEDHSGSDYHVFLEATRPLIVRQRRKGRLVTEEITVWSHKNGVGGEVTIFGPDGRLITDPRKAVGGRQNMLGYFLRPAEPMPIADPNFGTHVAPQHQQELHKGAQRLVRAAMLELYYTERTTGMQGDRVAQRQNVLRFCQQHGLPLLYSGGPAPSPPPRSRRARTTGQQAKATPE